MIMKTRIALLTLFACALFAAPAPQEAQAGTFGDVAKAVTNYVPNFVMDTVDIFKVDVSTGEGFGFDARATHMADVGFSDYDVARFGFLGRDDSGMVMTGDEANKDRGMHLLGVTVGERTSDPYDVGAKVHAFMGLEVSANLRKALDALTGLVFIDLEGDNHDYAGDMWG